MKQTVVVGMFLATVLAGGPVLGVGASGPSAAGTTGATGSQADVMEEVKRLFNEGVNAASKKQWEKARVSFEAAFKLKSLPQIAAHLGRAELKLGKTLKAAEHLEFYLRMEKDADADSIASVQELLNEAMAKRATLRVRVNVSGADVLIDGKPEGKAPLEVFLDPGSHTIEARLEGRPPTSRRVELVAGKELKLNLTLDAPKMKAGHEVERPWWKPTLYGSIGLAVVGFGFGIGFSVGVSAKNRAADDEAARLKSITASNRTLCPGGRTDPRCATLGDIIDTRDTYYGAEIAGYVVGGLATAGMITVLVLGSKKAKDSTALAPSVTVAPTAGGGMIFGTF